ncbi:MAG: preprotein translocase subunit SecE [Pelagibacterales bacterium]|nr:preprotein translocase subunit SecE [Pelagibacterales bacterium]
MFGSDKIFDAFVFVCLTKLVISSLKILNFLRDVAEELKKLHIPSKKETYITTVTILVTIIVVALAIGSADLLISTIIKAIFKVS